MQVTLTLTQEQNELVKKARETRDSKTETEIVQQALSLGLNQLVYRTKNNKKNWSEFKQWRESKRQ